MTDLDALKDRSFLKNARATLDADHFGLERIKRRLIEYLAVFRLKQLALATQMEAQQGAETSRVEDGVSALPTTMPKPPIRRGVKGPILLYVFGLVYLEQYI